MVEPKNIVLIVAVVVVLLIVIIVPIVVTQQKKGDNNCGGIVTLGKEIRNGDAYVSLIFTACPSQGAFDAFVFAANRWSTIINDNKIIPVPVDADTSTNDFCGEGFPEKAQIVKKGTIIDHLTIFVETIDIDGVNGILAQSGFCNAFDDNLFPLFGTMQFDNADLDSIERDGTIDEVITHEMGHVLGIGSLWPFVVPGSGAEANSVEESLLIDPVFDFLSNANQIIVNEANNPKFVGTAATAEFNTLGGATAFVPVQNAQPFLDRGLSAEDGQGSIDSHWEITVFDTELMTFQINSNDALHPLSTVSISSLTDLGYSVDLTKADTFSLPSARKAVKLSLRGEEPTVHFLGNDVKRAMSQKDIKLTGAAFFADIHARKAAEAAASAEP